MSAHRRGAHWVVGVATAVTLSAAMSVAQSPTFRAALPYPLPGSSQGTFYVPMLALADVGSPLQGPLNGAPDGIPDVIAISQDGTIAVLFGSRDPTVCGGLFCTGPNQTLQAVPTAFAAADFDGDHLVDLLISDNSNNVTFYKGSSEGPPFSRRGSTSAGNAPKAVVVADLNADGKLDAVIVDGGQSGGGGVTILIGNGDGTFHSKGFVQTGLDPSGAAVGDFDKDGKLDIAVANGGDKSVSILLGDGTGAFSLKRTINDLGDPVAIAAEDLNGDGFLDLVVVDGSGDEINVLDGKAGADFAAPRPFPSGTTYSEPDALALADVNGDGHTDVVVSNDFSSDVGILLGDGHGSFAAPRSYIADQEPLAVAVSDVDGDGVKDVLTLNKGVQQPDVAVLLGRSDGRFAAVEDISTDESPDTVLAADVDNDGLPDLIVGHPTGVIRVYRAKSGGGFAPPVSMQAAGEAGDGFVIGCADFNGDGRIDIVAVDKSTSQVSLFLAQTNGFPTTPQNYSVGAGALAVTVGDWNEDGRPDLAVARQGSETAGAVDILLTRPDGSFGSPVSFAVGANPVALDTGDFDKDGHRDLAVANSGSSTVSILLGNGDGTFQLASTIKNLPNVKGLVVADFDHDGTDDLAVILPTDLGVQVLYNQTLNQALKFVFGPSLPVSGTPAGLAARDMTGDDFPDVIVADQVDNAVYMFESKGQQQQFERDDGTFVGRGPSAIVPSAVVAADFDGDGRYDAATVDNFLAGTAPVLTNVLAPTVLRGDGNGDGAVTAADTIAVLLAAHNTNGIRVEDLPTDTYAAKRGVDANGDGVVNAQDALAVAHRLFMGS